MRPIFVRIFHRRHRRPGGAIMYVKSTGRHVAFDCLLEPATPHGGKTETLTPNISRPKNLCPLRGKSHQLVSGRDLRADE